MTDFATAAGAPDQATAETLNETAEAIRAAVASLRSARRTAEAWGGRNEDAAEIAEALSAVEQLPVLDPDQLAGQLADYGQAVLSAASTRIREMPGMGDSDSWALGWRSGKSDSTVELGRFAAELQAKAADTPEPPDPGPHGRAPLRGATEERRTPPPAAAEGRSGPAR